MDTTDQVGSMKYVDFMECIWVGIDELGTDGMELMEQGRWYGSDGVGQMVWNLLSRVDEMGLMQQDRSDGVGQMVWN